MSAHADHLVLESGDVVLPRLLAPLLGILRWRAGGSGAGGARAAAIRNRNEIVQIAVKSLPYRRRMAVLPTRELRDVVVEDRLHAEEAQDDGQRDDDDAAEANVDKMHEDADPI